MMTPTFGESSSLQSVKPTFENKPITNFDIMKWIEYLSRGREIDFKGVISRDEILGIHPHGGVGYYIANLNKSSESGSHWVVIYIKDNRCVVEYFDSFGLNAPEEVVELSEKMRVNYLFNSTQYQSLDSVLCGYWCLYFINERAAGRTYYELLKPFSHSDTVYNEKFIRDYFHHLAV